MSLLSMARRAAGAGRSGPMHSPTEDESGSVVHRIGAEIGAVDLVGFAATFIGIGMLSLYGLGRVQTRAT
jgi:hypothetical protein